MEDIKETKPESFEENNGSTNEQDHTENLSTKITNIGVVNSSIETVSKACHTIKESNSYIGCGMTAAESSLDKAFKAGKAVLDSRTLAPITDSAIKNIRYLDKEAGVIVDKFLKSNGKHNEGRQTNGAVHEDPGNANVDASSLAVASESMIYFLGRKFVEVTSFLILLPYFAPKFALDTILGLFQGASNEAGRKRKDRGSLSEEVKYMEPSPVKRKYGDRLSSSSEEEETLVEVLRNYVSEDDPDYVPEEHESEETSEESGNEEDRSENVKECLDLTQELEKMGVPLSPEVKKNVENMKNEDKQVESNKCQSTPKKELDSVPKDQTQKPAETVLSGKPENKTNASEQKLEEIPLGDASNLKNKTEGSKEAKESKGGKIDPSSKTRRSAKSPLLEKLLSPGRRSRKSQKDKAKTEKDQMEIPDVTEDVAGAAASKFEQQKKQGSSVPAKKLPAETAVDETSKGKSEEVKKKAEKAESLKKKEAKSGESNEVGNEAMSTVTGPFDVFKFGGKKSK